MVWSSATKQRFSGFRTVRILGQCERLNHLYSTFWLRYFVRLILVHICSECAVSIAFVCFQRRHPPRMCQIQAQTNKNDEKKSSNWLYNCDGMKWKKYMFQLSVFFCAPVWCNQNWNGLIEEKYFFVIKFYFMFTYPRRAHREFVSAWCESCSSVPVQRMRRLVANRSLDGIVMFRSHIAILFPFEQFWSCSITLHTHTHTNNHGLGREMESIYLYFIWLIRFCIMDTFYFSSFIEFNHIF